MTAIERTTRNRTCARNGCSATYDPFNRDDGVPARFCSKECARGKGRTVIPAKRKAISPASPAQRTAIDGRACVVCAQHAGHCHPAHLIDKSLAHDDHGDSRAVVPLCPTHHREYDDGGLSILEYLEPHWRSEIAYAVERHGLLRTLQRVTNQHWQPVSVVPVEREGTRDAA